jgi:hypothetical protein
LLGPEVGYSHFELDKTVFLDPRLYPATSMFEYPRLVFHAGAVRQQPRDTPRPVTALLDLAAIGVEDPVIGIGSVRTRWLEPEQLIKTDTGIPFGEMADQLAGRRSLAVRMDNDEVIAQ